MDFYEKVPYQKLVKFHILMDVRTMSIYSHCRQVRSPSDVFE